jgi:hypothetical protein
MNNQTVNNNKGTGRSFKTKMNECSREKLGFLKIKLLFGYNTYKSGE